MTSTGIQQKQFLIKINLLIAKHLCTSYNKPQRMSLFSSQWNKWRKQGKTHRAKFMSVLDEWTKVDNLTKLKIPRTFSFDILCDLMGNTHDTDTFWSTMVILTKLTLIMSGMVAFLKGTLFFPYCSWLCLFTVRNYYKSFKS